LYRKKGIYSCFEKIGDLNKKDCKNPEDINDLNGWLILADATLFISEAVNQYLRELGIFLIDPDQFEIKKRRGQGYSAIHINFAVPGIGSCEIMIMRRDDYYLYAYGQSARGEKSKSFRAVGKLSKSHWSYKLERRLGNINPKQRFLADEIIPDSDFATNCRNSFDALKDRVVVMVVSKTFRGYNKLTAVELARGLLSSGLALHPQIGCPESIIIPAFNWLGLNPGKAGNFNLLR
jgi:hypothetical protein